MFRCNSVIHQSPSVSRRTPPFRRLMAVVLIGALCIGAWGKGRGYKTWTFRQFVSSYGRPLHPPHPCVVRTRPADHDANVLPDGAFIAADVDLPYSGEVVDGATLNGASVKLYRAIDRRPVSAIVNTSGAGDAIVLRPMQTLDANTQYTFEVTSLAKDTGGHSFRNYKANFWTAAGQRFSDFPVAFEKKPLPDAAGSMFTCVTIGPDHRLYASTLAGRIFRYSIRPDGAVYSPAQIDTINAVNGCRRLITGITFDPSATADHLVLWVSHGELTSQGEKGQVWIRGARDWTGKITRLTGQNLDECRDVVIGLPRGWKDHLNNQMVFGPDGALYFCQAANTAMGAPDHKWGFRPERLLSAAILRLDVKAIEGRVEPLNVQTEEGGHYDPFSPNAALTIYATGIRNSYDLLWHSNGMLYAGINGSAAGGNSPASPAVGAESFPRIDAAMKGPYHGPAVPALNNIPETEDDMLFKVVRGGYYGHPNPTRAEYVLNGGNPSPDANPYQVHAYPRGTCPDRNWRPAIFSFGKNLSPCGVIEYLSPLPGDALDHKILYARYSGGDDILALSLDSQGNVAESIAGIEGCNHFVNPVDLTEDLTNGNLYVAEFGGKRITLLRPLRQTITADASHHVCRVQYNAPQLSSGAE